MRAESAGHGGRAAAFGLPDGHHHFLWFLHMRSRRLTAVGRLLLIAPPLRPGRSYEEETAHRCTSSEAGEGL